MTIYKVVYERKSKPVTEIVKDGELGVLLNKCQKKHYRIVNISHI